MTEVVIYTIPNCGYCWRACRLLESKGVAYVEHDVSSNPAALAEIRTIARTRTFPQILIGGTLIGGCDELRALERAGKLDALLY